MMYYGADLVQTTWFQAYPEFTYIRVGAVYSAIPGGGFILLLFIIESVFYPGRHGGRRGRGSAARDGARRRRSPQARLLRGP